jgi:hypothetical protein
MIKIDNIVLNQRHELINLIIWVDKRISFVSEVLPVEPKILNFDQHKIN